MGSSNRYRQQSTVRHIVQREGDILYHFRPGTTGYTRGGQIRSTVGGNQLDTYPNLERLQGGHPETANHSTGLRSGYRYEDPGNTSVLDLDICSGLGEGPYRAGLGRHERKRSGRSGSKDSSRRSISSGRNANSFVGKSSDTAKLSSGLLEYYLHRGRRS